MRLIERQVGQRLAATGKRRTMLSAGRLPPTTTPEFWSLRPPYRARVGDFPRGPVLEVDLVFVLQ
jgi:hypothetical protein